ncbi:hypothetical protein ACWEIJ_13060 [Lentzea sp. NPDC004789]
MRSHVARSLTLLVVLIGPALHIGLGYRLGLLVAGIAIAAHLVLGAVGHKVCAGSTG